MPENRRLLITTIVLSLLVWVSVAVPVIFYGRMQYAVERSIWGKQSWKVVPIMDGKGAFLRPPRTPLIPIEVLALRVIPLVVGLALTATAFVIIAESKSRFGFRSFAIGELSAGCAAILLLTGIAISDGLEGVRMQTCKANLDQIYDAITAYSNKNHGMFPPIDAKKNKFMFNEALLYPEYLRDKSAFTCPSNPAAHSRNPFHLRSTRYHSSSIAGEAHFQHEADESYCYIGWALTSEKEARAFFEAYDKLSPAAPAGYEGNLIVRDGEGNPCEVNLLQPNPKRGNVINRLRENVELEFYKQRWRGPLDGFVGSTAGWDQYIPIIWDRGPYHKSARSFPFSRRTSGVLVLHYTGDVWFVPWGEFPMTEAFAKMLEERKHQPISRP